MIPKKAISKHICEGCSIEKTLDKKLCLSDVMPGLIEVEKIK